MFCCDRGCERKKLRARKDLLWYGGKGWGVGLGAGGICVHELLTKHLMCAWLVDHTRRYSQTGPHSSPPHTLTAVTKLSHWVTALVSIWEWNNIYTSCRTWIFSDNSSIYTVTTSPLKTFNNFLSEQRVVASETETGEGMALNESGLNKGVLSQQEVLCCTIRHFDYASE